MAEQEDWVATARLAVAASMGDDADLSMYRLAEAQVYATLALAEQQRIANLIALSQAADANGWLSEEAVSAVFIKHWTTETGQGHCTIAPEMARALGIKTRGDEA